MTPTEQWILCLALVYSLPSFVGGVGITLLFVYWRDIRQAAAMVPVFLAPASTLERRDVIAPDTRPADDIHGHLTDRLRLR